MKLRLIILPCLALAGMTLGAFTIVRTNQILSAAEPVADPARSPYAQRIAASGVVEAATENHHLGTPVSGLIERVLVKHGQRVKKDSPLIVLDSRAARAEVELAEAQVRVAQAHLQRLQSSPRPESVPPAKARLAQRQAGLKEAEVRLSTVQEVKDPRAVSRELLQSRKAQRAAAQALLEGAKAELKLIEAGAWQADIEVTKAELSQAQARLTQARTALDLRTLKAPFDGQVLAINARVGEFAQAGLSSEGIVVFGVTERLHIRASIDEYDAWKFKQESQATAYLRGNAAHKMALSFVRAEPFVIPKRSLTGSSQERVDTRVFQVIYAIDSKAEGLRVGQQVDVFMEAATNNQ